MKEIIEINVDNYSFNSIVVYIKSKNYLFDINSNHGIRYVEDEISFNNHPYKKFENYTKNELELFQNILLKAYVKSQITLEEFIEKKESKMKLERIKTNILCIRVNLIKISEYIDDYDEMIEEYKEI